MVRLSIPTRQTGVQACQPGPANCELDLVEGFTPLDENAHIVVMKVETSIVIKPAVDISKSRSRQPLPSTRPSISKPDARFALSGR
jgi:hypothetical protein